MPEATIEITLNGIKTDFPAKATILTAIEYLKPESTYVAAELNGEILEKTQFSSIELKSGDHLEIIQPLGGGSR